MKYDPMKYDAVIFDLFGTLVDNPYYAEHLRAEYHGVMRSVAATLEFELDDFLRVWSDTEDQRYTGFFPTMEGYLEHLCRSSDLAPSEDQLTHAARIRLEYFRGVLTSRADTLDTLRQLRSSGYKIGLISDCAIEDSILWPSTPLAPLVDAAILSCDVGLRKPDPRIYQLACDRLAVTPNRCLYVGDGGSQELTGASEMGMDPVLIRAPNDTVTGNREDWPGVRIASLREVLALVLNS